MLKGTTQGEPSTGKAFEDTSPSFQDVDFDFGAGDADAVFDNSPEEVPFRSASAFPSGTASGHDAFTPSQLIGLGMAEAPPPPEVIEELYVVAVHGRDRAN